MESGSDKVVRFGVFELDVGARELRKRGVRLRLQDQPFRVLEALLEKPGEIVTREQLKDLLWSPDEFVEFDKSLNTAIQKIRQALGDSAENPRFLDTVPRLGYKFIAPVNEIEAAMAGESDEEPAVLPRRLATAWLGVGLALLVAGVALGMWLRPSSQDFASVRLAKFTLSPQLPIGASSIRKPTPSPDGRYVAFTVGSTDQGRTLMVWDAEQDKYRALTTGAGLGLFWSPDSRQIGLITDKAVLAIDLESGAERTLASWPGQLGWTPYDGTWSPDGETIVFSAGPATIGNLLYRMSASGGKYEPLVEPTEVEVSEGRGFFDPSFLPVVSGRQALLYAEGAGYPDIGVINLQTGERRTIASGVLAYGQPLYSPSGHVIYRDSRYRRRGRLWALPFSLERLEPTGDAFAIAESAAELGISAHGMLTYGKPELPVRMQLAWRDRSGKRLGSIGEAQEEIFTPTLSPNGREVVVIGATDRLLDVWIHEVDRPVKRRITFDETRKTRPTWHPSGKQVTFSRGVSGGSLIWIAATEGGGNPTLLYESPSSEHGFEWSRNGKYLVGSGRHFLFYLRADIDGNGWEKVVLEDDRFDHVGPELSPDGRYVAYQSDESGRAEVYVRPFPEGGGRWQISIDGGGQPRWQGAGNEIFYVKDDTLMVVPVTSQENFTHGAPRALFDGKGVFRGRGQNYDVTADGQRFVVVEGVRSAGPREIQVVLNWSEEFRDR